MTILRTLGFTFLFILILSTIVLGLYRPPIYIRNFEADEYGAEGKFLEPTAVVDGLAVYTIGTGRPVLLIPYPHSHTTEPMAQEPLAEILVSLGRRVITFDVPGAHASTRDPVGDMDEMIRAANETLDYFGVDQPIDVVGHSMSGFVALAFAVERPDGVRSLVLSNSVSGFPAAARCGFPGSAFSIFEADYWRLIVWGMRLNAGRGNLAMHKRLQNLMEGASFHDQSFFSPLEIDQDDAGKGVPIRMLWSRNMYSGLSYANRLGEVEAPTLVIAGRHDPEASLECSEELTRGIEDAQLAIFDESGHAPFIEEQARYVQTLGNFLNSQEVR